MHVMIPLENFLPRVCRHSALLSEGTHWLSFFRRDILSLITKVLICRRCFPSRLRNMCARAFISHRRQYDIRASTCTRMARGCIGTRPKLGETRRSRLCASRAQDHVETDTHARARACIMRANVHAACGICTRPRVQRWALCHIVYRGQ